MSTKASIEKTLIFGCAHAPFHDVKATEAMFDFIRYWKPDRIISNGDGADLYSASKYFKNPDRKNHLQDEADGVTEFHTNLRLAAGRRSEIIYNFGNHDARYEMYLSTNAPELRTVRELSFERLFGLEANGIVANRGQRGTYAKYFLGDIAVGHFPIARSHSAYTEKALVDAHGVSCIASHSHRKGVFYKTLLGGRVVQGVGTGHLCDVSQADYIDDPNWQQGFVIVEKLISKPRYFLTDININGGNILFDGRLF